MQLSITKSVALTAFIMYAAMSQAQIKISKVANGTRTAVASGGKIDVRIQDDEKALENIVVDIDIAAFKKAYKYDLVGVYYKWQGTTMGYYEHEFDSQLNTKKYGGKGVIPVYLFDTKNFKETDFRTLAEGTYYSGPEGEKTREILIKGYYITGEEGYFDRNDMYKTRNTYSEGELITKVPFGAVFTPEAIAAHDLRLAQNMVSNMSDRFENNVKSNITQYVAPYVATPLYGALADGIQDVWNAKVAAVMAEKDAQKALDGANQLEKDFEVMMNVSRKDKSILKTMNKEIKSKTTIDQKWELIQANA
jgi:hypothetical protein